MGQIRVLPNPQATEMDVKMSRSGLKDMKQNVIWTLVEDFKLIEFVESHEILYRERTNDYIITEKKNKYWSELGNSLHKSGRDCKNRWLHLKGYYVRRKRNPKPGMKEAWTRRVARLAFLDSCLYSKSSKETTSGESTEDLNNKVQYKPKDNEQNKSSELKTSEQVSFQKNTKISPENSFENKKCTSDNDRGEHREKSERPTTLDSKRKVSNLKPQQNQQEPDVNDLYYLYIAKCTKNLHEDHQEYVRTKTWEALSNCQKDNLASKTSSMPTQS